MRKSIVRSAVFLSALLATSSADAFVQCVTPPVCTFADGIGTVGGNFAINNVWSFTPGYTALEFTRGSDFKIWVDGDTKIGRLPYQIWSDVTIGNASLSPNISVNFLGSDISRSVYGGMSRTMEFSKLTLNHVDLNTDIKFLFAGNDNQINLSNSSIFFSSQQPGFYAISPLTISALEGANTIRQLNTTIDSQSTALNISPGATLTFEDSGNVWAPGNTTDLLYFRSPVTGNIDNGTLRIRRSNVRFNSTAFAFRNNSQLEASGSQSKVQFNNVSFQNSGISLDNNTEVIASTVNFDGATLLLNSGARFTADIVNMVNNTALSGSMFARTGFNVGIVDINPGAIFTHNGSLSYFDHLYVANGSTVEVNGGILSADSIHARGLSGSLTGGAINVNSGGELFIGGGIDRVYNDMDITIKTGGAFEVGSKANLEIGPALNLTINGFADVYGFLAGKGTIAGNGRLDIHENAAILPGNIVVAGERINTLRFDNTLVFANNALPGMPVQPQYRVDIDVVGGVAQNDLIQYNNNNMDLTKLVGIHVETVNALSANDLDGKSFTVISSVDGASSGTLIRGVGDPKVYEGGSIPALIDFTVSNENTNSNDDVTLNAVKQSASSLITHQGSKTKNKTGGAKLVVNAHASGSSAITGALNTLTNSQVGTHLQSIHAEPYSSWLTVNLEHTDQILNVVLDNAWQAGNHGFWIHSSHSSGNVNGKDDLGSFDYRLNSIVVGADLNRSVNSRFGVFAGFGVNSMGEHDLVTQSFSAQSYHVGAYGYYQLKDWQFRVAGGFSHFENDSKRAVALSALSGTNKASYAGRSVYAGIEGRYDAIQLSPWLSVSPLANALATFYRQDGFNERGVAALALSIDNAEAASFITGIGAHFEGTPILKGKIIPTALVKYEHDWIANSRGAHSVNAGMVTNPNYLVEFDGQHRGPNSLTFGVGLATGLGSNWRVSGDITASLHDHGHDISAQFKARLEF